jgi:hypothetical protein
MPFDGAVSNSVVSINDATTGESIIGQPITTEALWRQWNITITDSSTTDGTNVIRVYPADVSVTGGETSITWRSWNNSFADLTATTSTSSNVINIDTSIVSHNTGQITLTSSSSTTINNNLVWQAWSREAPHVWRQMSREQREAHEAQEQQWQERQRRQQQETAEAEAKAERLLLSCLTPEQRETYQRRSCFYLYTREGRKYRIDKGWAGNVKLVDETDQVLSSFCIHPSITVPYADNMLGQKLMLEADEKTFMRVANETVRGGGRRVTDRILAA